MPEPTENSVSPLAKLHARLSEMALEQKEAHTSLLMAGERVAAAHAWSTYQEARDVSNAVASMIRQTEEDLSDI